ncbi:MAG: septum formation protein Maf [Deltaproteobacteria bacterium]|nr:septum formation protein Maf [Deltaproteobacteria bacterium]
MPALVLASTSAYRRAQLDRLGVPYVAAAHQADESVTPERASLDEVARFLARAKAESLAARFPEAWIIGSDQLVDLDGERLGKPGSVAAAEAQLARLAGRAHRLLTAVALRAPSGTVEVSLDAHVMQMRSIGAEEIRRYVAADQPIDCAGAYKIEARGIALFEAVEGSDHTAIVGLPLIALTTMLRRAGFLVP